MPSPAPGGRAPHAWLHDGSSLFDNFGQGMTLLALPGVAKASLEAATRDAARLGIPLKVLPLDNPALPALYNRRLTLIRPDQHIAWTGDVWPAAEDFDVLAMATGQGPVAAFKTIQKETLHEPGT